MGPSSDSINENKTWAGKGWRSNYVNVQIVQMEDMRACWWRLSRVRRSKKVSNDSPSSSITHKLAAYFLLWWTIPVTCIVWIQFQWRRKHIVQLSKVFPTIVNWIRSISPSLQQQCRHMLVCSMCLDFTPSVKLFIHDEDILFSAELSQSSGLCFVQISYQFHSIFSPMRMCKVLPFTLWII